MTAEAQALLEPEHAVSQLRLDGAISRLQPDLDELASLIQALLLVAATPPTIEELAEAADVEQEHIRKAIDRLALQPSAGWIVQVHGEKVHLATAPRFARQVRTFLGLEREGKLSSAAMETLAIIAYRQPVTRAEIDAVRGVDSSGVLATLHARELIEPVARLAAVGNPFQYGTTPAFLRLFGLQSLDDLPELGSFSGTDGLTLLSGAMEAVTAKDQETTVETAS